METWRLEGGGDVGELVAGEWRRCWRLGRCGELAAGDRRQCRSLGGWGVETTLETWQLGSGHDLVDFTDVKWRLGGWDWKRCGDLADVEYRRRWRLGSWEVETTLETWQLGSGEDVGDLVAGEWRRRWRLRRCGELAAGDKRQRRSLGGWGVKTTLETSRLGSGDDIGDFADVEWRQRWRLGSWGVDTTL